MGLQGMTTPGGRGMSSNTKTSVGSPSACKVLGINP